MTELFHSKDRPTVSMLTTIDNPWSPFTHFKEWYLWDETHGYYTSGLLARITFSSYELSESDQDAAREKAMDDIVAMNVSGKHIKVTKYADEVEDL